MTPAEVGHSYDTIADRWRMPGNPLTGIPQHETAIRFVKNRGEALDVGCGCNGRFIDLLRREGFAITGIDVSARMIALARERDPDLTFEHADICQWSPPKKYDFITGWDSIWHVPLASQERVLTKLCEALAPGGVLIFTMGGTDVPNEVRDAFMGPPMYHATLGIPKTLALLAEHGMVCRHLEYDQHPESHVYIIAQKT